MNRMKKVMIFGISGTVGKALTRTLNENYEVYGTYHHRKPNNLPLSNIRKLSIENHQIASEFLSDVKPDYVIMALRGNFQQQLTIHCKTAEVLKGQGGRMIFCSTTNVFDDLTDSPHDEDDTPKAESDYGKFKIECENALRETLGDQLTVIRIPAILGQDAPRINELRETLKAGDPVMLYTNLYTSINSDAMLSKQIEYLMNQELGGIYHLATTDIMLHSDFTKKLLAAWGYTHFEVEEAKLEPFSGAFPDPFYFALQSKKTLPGHLQITHDELINDLAGSTPSQNNGFDTLGKMV